MKKLALIIGGANTVFADIEEAYGLFRPDAVFAINDVVEHFEDVDYFCSMHPEKSDVWLGNREDNGYAPPRELWTAHDRVKRAPAGMEYKSIGNTRGGSGLLAVYVAKKLGFERIVLAGIPMHANNAHFFDNRQWRECRLYQVVWEADPSLRDGSVRSLSGWTKEQFGYPDVFWLNG